MKDCVSQGQPVPESLIAPLRESTPVVSGGEEIRRQLADEGYLFFRGVLDVDDVMAAREEIFTRLMEVGEITPPAIEGIFSGESRRRELVDDLGRFWQSVSEGAAFRQVSHGPQVRTILSTIFGEPARAHDFIFLRPSPVGRMSNLHYDYPFFARGSDRVLTVWIPLGPVPVSDGPLIIVEGGDRFEDLLKPTLDADVDSNSAPKVSFFDDVIEFTRSRNTRLLTANFHPGDLLVFGMRTLHGSLDNHSPIGRARLSCDIRYQPAAEPIDERYVGPNPNGTTGAGYGELNGAKPLTEPWHIR